MPGENIYDWSTTASNNDTADILINWRENQARSSVNDSSRSEMAAHAKNRNLLTGTITTGGSANAQTFTSGVGYTVMPTGMRVLLKIGFSNTGTTTLNMDSISAVTVKNKLGTDLVGGELVLNSYEEFLYNGTNWILLQDPGPDAIIARTTVTTPVSVVSFTDLDAVHYDGYRIIASRVQPSVDAFLVARFSTDNGVTSISTSTYENVLVAHYASLGSVPVEAIVQTATWILIGGTVIANSTNSQVPSDQVMHFFPGAGRIASLFSHSGNYSPNGMQFGVSSGTNTTNAGVNSIQFLFNTGTIVTGSFTVIGLGRK